jgi:hypothetical protein
VEEAWYVPLSREGEDNIVSHFPAKCEVVQLIARDHTKRKRDGSKAERSSLPTIQESGVGDGLMRTCPLISPVLVPARSRLWWDFGEPS